MSITVDRLFYGAHRSARLVTLEQTILNPDQTEEARQTYNSMVDGWRADGATISHIAREIFDINPAQADYSIGPNGDWDTEWPDRIERAGILVTQNGNPVPEYPMHVLTIDEYQLWTLKTQETNWPWCLWYERSGPPLGTVHLLYVPTDGNQVALYLEQFLLPIDATGDTTIEFPPGYQEAIESNLAVRLAARTPGAQLAPGMEEIARTSFMRIKNANNRPLARVSDFQHGSYRSSVYNGNRYGNRG